MRISDIISPADSPIPEGKRSKDPCWPGYKQVGMKDKDGKSVPNCVPESAELDEESMKDEDAPCWDDYEMVGMKTKDGRNVPNCVPKKKS